MTNFETGHETQVASARRRYATYLAGIMAAATLSLALPSTHVTAAEMDMACTADNDAVPRLVDCAFRLNEPAQLETLTLKANDEPLTDSRFTPFTSEGNRSAWLYLIDTSNPRRTRTVSESVDVVREQLRTVSSSRQIGVATFANELQQVLPIAPSHALAGESLDAIRADGVATELFSSALEAIELLGDVDADRKALVILSDGKAEDTAYTRQDVLIAARDAGVTIFALGTAENASETPSLQELRRLAQETGGRFISRVAGDQIDFDGVNDFTRTLENGGTVSASLDGIEGDVRFTLEAGLATGETVMSEQEVLIAPVPAPEPEPEPVVEPEPEPLSTIASIYTAFDGFAPGASQWANANGFLAWMLLALPIGLLLGVVIGMTQRKDPVPVIDDEPEEPVTQIVDAEDDNSTRMMTVAQSSAFGHFEVVGHEEMRFPVVQQSMSIGRHSDNDIQLANDSVHRHHAHLHVTPEGDISVHDLDTANGVIVNGERVPSATLRDGDMLELGEVRLRLVQNNV